MHRFREEQEGSRAGGRQQSAGAPVARILTTFMPLLDDDTAIATLLRSSRSIAVVGASDKPYRDSYAITRYLLSAGYTVYPINPTVPAVLGLRTYPDLKSIGAPVDIVDVFRRPELVPPIVEEAISTGARTVW